MELRVGLRNVIAGQTSICFLDKENHKLYYFGYSIDQLVKNNTFEEVVYLLLHGELPASKEVCAFPEGCSSIKTQTLKTLKVQPRTTHPMDMLATLVRSEGNGSKKGNSLAEDRQEALKLSSKVALMTGVMSRWYQKKRRLCLPNVYPHVSQNILYQLRGKEPTDFERKLMDAALILYAEHEINASTFAVRIAASSHTDIYSAIVVGIGILKGPRHGGANEEAMKIMLEISRPENVKSYLDKFFETKGARLPGFGHPVYTKSDPRVTLLRPLVKELSILKRDMRWYQIALNMEEYMANLAAKKGKPIPANIDLWTAPLYYLLGIPINLYTPLFAASRVAGWSANYIEVKYITKEHIIRPRAEYVGPKR